VKAGDVFGRWTLLYPGRNSAGKKIWLCRCRCLTIREVLAANLVRRTGRPSRGCGCHLLEMNEARRRERRESFYVSPEASTPRGEYHTWKSMRRRCLDPRDIGFKNYGGRGITVCRRWVDSFEAFLEDVGPRPSPTHTLDRIDNSGNYEPGNVRWATWGEQARNRSDNHLVTYQGATRCLMDWSTRTGLPFHVLWDRLKKWPVERAFTEPLRVYPPKPPRLERPPKRPRVVRERRPPDPRRKKGHTSRFRGVSRVRIRSLSKPWSVMFRHQGKMRFIGYFTTEEEAARAYDKAALELIGPTAILNFPREEEAIA
jgi:hypothetical protein